MHKYWELIGKPRSSDNDPLGSVKTDILVTLSYVNLTDLNKFSNSGVGMSIHLALGDYPTVLSNAKLGRTKCRFASFLADRTIGRAYGTACRLSVCLSSSVTFCIVAQRCVLAKKCLKE